MRPLPGIIAIAVTVAISAAPSRGQTNTSPLRGSAPAGFQVLPPLPPTGFYAWCATRRGLCMVQGNAPIAPGSLCHCAEFEGRTP
jgi:hypothetical protein